MNKDAQDIGIRISQEEEIAYSLGKNLGLPVVHVSTSNIDLDTATSIPRELCESHLVLPILKYGGEITLVMADPNDKEIIGLIEEISGLKVKIVLGMKSNILKVLSEIYTFIDNRKKKIVDSHKELDITISEDTTGMTSLYFHLTSALEGNAEEIHFAPFSEGGKIFYRRNGILLFRGTISKEVHRSTCLRLKKLIFKEGNNEIFTGENAFKVKISEREILLNISFLNTFHGDCANIRIFDISQLNNRIKTSSFLRDEEKLLREILKCESGIILVGGRRRSGRTTIIYSILNLFNPLEKRIAVIESAPLHINENYLQINIEKHEFIENFCLSSGFSIDVIAIQDILLFPLSQERRNEILKTCLRRAEDGTLVLLECFGEDPLLLYKNIIESTDGFSVPSFIWRGVLVQRLAKTPCPECREKNGCERCFNTGVVGLKEIREILVFDRTLHEFIEQDVSVYKMKQYLKKKGHITLHQKILKGIETGEICPEEENSYGNS